MFKILIFIILSIASIFAECPKGSERFGTKCYQFFKNPEEYIFAAIHCWSLYGFSNGNLTSIHDLSENFYIQDTASIAFNGSSDDIWIGGIHVPDSDQWIWEDKSNFSWTNWKNDDQVNDTQINRRVSMDLSTGLWLSSDMNEKKPFVCQVYNRDETTTTTTVTVTPPTTTVILPTTTITLPTITVTPPPTTKPSTTVTSPTTTTSSTTTVTLPSTTTSESNKSCDNDDNKSIVAFCNRTLAKLQKGVTVWYCCKNECFQGELRKRYCNSD